MNSEKIELTLNEFISIYKALEETLLILHKSEWCEDADVRAYGLAIAMTEADLSYKIADIRKMLTYKLNKQQNEYLEMILDELSEPIMPYDKTPAKLKEMLSKYMVTPIKSSELNK
ncbi:MAG: hypothetical protein IJ368_02275 [Oscillospiraceae bacterium]|nr:hypothetical protein [Oscillospiraceae bacterium]